MPRVDAQRLRAAVAHEASTEETLWTTPLRQIQDPEAAVIAEAAGAAGYRETFHIAWAEAQSPTREVLRAAQAAAAEAAANAYQATYDDEITIKEATR